jgi:hypothetical protein
LAAGGEVTNAEFVTERDRPDGPGPVLMRASVVIPACYLAGALLLTWRLWADPASTFVAPNAGDANLFAWYLRYAATAISHGHLPALVTTAMNAPTGVNLMWNTSLLLPGVLLTPVTLLLGPQVSLTILTTAGFAGSATAMFWVLRRWRVGAVGSALAGAVYGFSPALVHSAVGHYNLQLAVLPPLIVDASVRLAVGPRHQTDGSTARDSTPPASRDVSGSGTGWASGASWVAALRTGVWLGLLVAAQLFISEELALITALAAALFVAAVALSRPIDAVRRAPPVMTGLLVAVVIVLALAGHALWVQFHGPLVQHGPLYPLDYYVNELSGFVTPSSYLVFHTAGSAATAAGYHAGLTEYLAYLGWPMIIVVVAAAVVGWRRVGVRAAAFTLIVLVVFSFGGHPQTRGVPDPTVNLPWHWLEEHQLLSSILPDRLSILIDGAAAVLLALGLDAVTGRAGLLGVGRGVADSAESGAAVAADSTVSGRAGGMDSAASGWPAAADSTVSGRAGGVDSAASGRLGAAGGQRSSVGWADRGWVASFALTLAVLACVSLLPGPLPAATTTPLPRGWSEVFTALHLPSGARVLVVPVPTNILTVAMRWQADTGHPSSMVGGYFIGPGAGGQAYIGGNGVSPTSWYLDRLWAAGLPQTSPFAGAAGAAGLATASPAGPASAGRAPSRAKVLADLASWRPTAIVAVTAAGSPLANYLVALLGPPSVQSATVIAWRH